MAVNKFINVNIVLDDIFWDDKINFPKEWFGVIKECTTVQ